MNISVLEISHFCTLTTQVWWPWTLGLVTLVSGLVASGLVCWCLLLRRPKQAETITEALDCPQALMKSIAVCRRVGFDPSKLSAQPAPRYQYQYIPIFSLQNATNVKGLSRNSTAMCFIHLNFMLDLVGPLVDAVKFQGRVDFDDLLRRRLSMQSAAAASRFATLPAG